VFTLGAYFGPMFLLNSTAPVTGGGQVFGIRAYLGDESWSSFCAHAGSTGFANHATCNGYLTAGNLAAEKQAMLVSAFNYINDTYNSVAFGETANSPQLGGGLGVNGYANCYFDPMWFAGEYATDPSNDYATRIFSQIIVWNIMDGIALEDLLTDVLPGAYKVAIQDIYDNAVANAYTGGEFDAIVYLVCANGGLDHEMSCQPQVFPIYGGGSTTTFDNKTKDPNKGSVSFYKVKYSAEFAHFGDFGVGSDEFSFDLYKMDENSEYTILIGTYKTDASGMVTASDLEPGKYVFTEVFGYANSYFFGNNEAEGWGFLWAIFPDGADGLYFEILANGDAEWTDGTIGNQCPDVVNNILLCKHNIMWTVEYAYQPGSVQNPNGPGWIVYQDVTANYCGGYLVAIYIPATCYKPASIAFGCSEGCGLGTGVDVAPALGHDWDYANPFAVYNVDGQPAPGTIVYGCINGCQECETVNDISLWCSLVCAAYGIDQNEEGWYETLMWAVYGYLPA